MDNVSTSASTAELVEMFIGAKLAAGLSVRTVGTYRQRLGYFVNWLSDRQITRVTLRSYLGYLQQQATLTATSRASYFRDVSVFCNWLVEERIWESSPAYKLAPKVPKTTPASYRPEHVLQLLALCETRDRAIITMLLDSGLRVSELVSLQQRDIDWKTGEFTVTGKGSKPRQGWLETETIELLQEMLEERDDDDPALWHGRKGPLTSNGVHQALERLAQRAGIRADVRRLVHAFRATFAKNYVRAGGDLESLRRLLGHEDIAMSAHYAQLANDELAVQKRRVNPLRKALEAAAD